ncbi:MAG: right-handed parallel beta-helix repeat-containing protein [Byssovorax sp.]
MASKVDCARCGAAVPIPDDLAVFVLTCAYCGAQQDAPDLVARRRAVNEKARSDDQRRFSNQIQQDVLANTRSAQKFSRWMMIPGLVIGGIAMIAGLAPVLRMAIGSSLASSWDGMGPFECGGNDEQKISGVTATLGGTAIYARGNCHLTIESCHIKAQTGIDASGNARVIIKGGSVEGAIAIDASGNATVDNSSGKVTGKAKKSANARITGVP